MNTNFGEARAASLKKSVLLLVCTLLSFGGCGFESKESPLSSAEPVAKYAYVSDVTNENVHVCELTSGTVLLDSCTITTGGIATWAPTKFLVTTIGGSKRVYVADQAGYVYICAIDATTKALSNCTASNGGVSAATWTPGSITIAEVNGVTYAYVTDIVSDVYLCTVNTTTGELGGCAISNGGAVGWWPSNVKILELAGTTYAYVPEIQGNVYLCTINTVTGALTACAPNNDVMPVGGWFTDVEFITVNGTLRAYVTVDADVHICAVDSNTGAFSACTVSNAGTTWSPDAITQISLNGVLYVHIADFFGNVFACTLDSTNGTLSSCSATNGGETTWKPSMAILDI